MRLSKFLLFVTCSWSFLAFASPSDEIKLIDAKYVDQLTEKKFDPIRNKFPLAPKSEASLPMLSDSTKVTISQKKALEAYQNWGKEYVSELKTLLDRYAPAQSENIDWRYHESMRLVADIYSGKLNWGEFNKQWGQIGPEYSKRVIATNNQIQQQKIAAHNQQVEAENQQAQVAKNKKIQYCQSLIQAMQVNCKQSQPSYGGSPLADLSNVMNNFDPAAAYECGSLKSRYNNTCQ